MKKLIIISCLSLLVLFVKGQGKPEGPPWSPVSREARWPDFIVVKQDFLIDTSQYLLQLRWVTQDSCFRFYVLVRDTFSTGKVVWETYFSFPLDKEVYDPQVISIDEDYYLFYENSKGKWERKSLFLSPKEKPAPSRFLFYKADLIFSAKEFISPSSYLVCFHFALSCPLVLGIRCM